MTNIVAEVLRGAADLIRMNGLHKGGLWPNADKSIFVPLYPGGQPCCAWGAIYAAEQQLLNGECGTGVSEEAGRAVREEVSGIGYAFLSDWVDAPSRTGQEVVDAMLAAAKGIENQETV